MEIHVKDKFAGIARRFCQVSLMVMSVIFMSSLLYGQDDVMAPKDRQWYLNYTEALDLIKSGEFERAAQLLETAITQKPSPKKNTKFYGNIRRPYLPHFYLGKAYFNLGKYELAKTSLQKSRQFGQAASLDEGQDLVRLLGQIDVKIAELEEQRRRPATNADYDRGLELFTEKKYAEARPLLEKVKAGGDSFAGKADDLLVKIAEEEAQVQQAEALQREVADLARRADNAYKAKNYQQAVDLYTDVSRKKPDFPGVFENKARAEAAVRLAADLKQARQLAGTNPAEAEDLLERIRRERSDFSGLEEVAQLIAQEKRNRELQDRKATLTKYLVEGVEAFNQGRWEQAERRFISARNLQPTPDQQRDIESYLQQIGVKKTRLNRIRSLLAQGETALTTQKIDDARAAFESVLVEDPGNKEAEKFLRLVEMAESGDAGELAGRLLRDGVRLFLQGGYAEAATSISTYLSMTQEKAALAKFLLGAAQISQYYMAQMDDAQLIAEGRRNLMAAKEAESFVLPRKLRAMVSPRILDLYEKENLDKP